MKILAKQLLTPQGFLPWQAVTVENGRVLAVAPARENDPADEKVEYLTPGLIDLHCHGGEGFNARDFGLEQISPFLDRMLRVGVTDFLMTISTGRKEVMRHGLEVTRQAMEAQAAGKLGGACIRGAHLEGPFLSSASAGAMQISAMTAPSKAAFLDYFHGYEDIIQEVTLAPEEPGADELMTYLRERHIQVQAGHTNATYDQAVHGYSQGAGSLCHSFNGCRGIHHREPGVVVASLESEAVYMEAICDLVHLHPATIRLIHRMKGPERMILISDSTVTHGLPDGEYFAEGYDIIVRGGVSRTKEGALDGGGAYLDEAVRNVHSIGIPLTDALRMASETPARRMGWDQLGVIQPGALAHLTGWDQTLRPILMLTDHQMIKNA